MKTASFLAICGLLAVVGCSSNGGKITFESIDHKRVRTQRFGEAYIGKITTEQDAACITKTANNEIEAVLIEDRGTQEASRSSKRKPIQPMAIAPLRQVMRIHMYWRPMALTTKNPAAINASIDWYVLGPEGSSDMLVYEGAAFVVLEGRGDTRRIRIKDGQIRPKFNESEGRLRDPIGAAKMHGSVRAVISKGRVEETLKLINQQVETAAK